MAREAMIKIKAAEEKAACIREEAEKKACEMVALAESEGARALDKATNTAEAVNRQKLDAISAHADEIVNATYEEAKREAAKLNRFTLSKRRDAVKLIVQGIFEQCQ
jgi:vacuolar-type H+-ATPase subunit H